MAGPAADNTNLRAQLRLAISDPGKYVARQPTYQAVPSWIFEAIWPLVVAFGDARYQEGRNDGVQTAQGVAVAQAASLYVDGEKTLAAQVALDVAKGIARHIVWQDEQDAKMAARGEG